MPHVELPSAEFKVVLLGDTNTGKTCLVLRLVEGSYKPLARSSTVGAFFLTKRLTVNNITCKMLLWDTAGQEQFQKLAVTYYQHAAAAIVCYDSSNPHSVVRLRRSLQELDKYIKQNHTPMVLAVAACKCDLQSSSSSSGGGNGTAVPGLEAEARRIAKSYDALYFPYTSAKNNQGVTEVFTKTAARVLEWHELAVTGQARPLPVTVGSQRGPSANRISPSKRRLSGITSTGTATSRTSTPVKSSGYRSPSARTSQAHENNSSIFNNSSQTPSSAAAATTTVLSSTPLSAQLSNANGSVPLVLGGGVGHVRSLSGGGGGGGAPSLDAILHGDAMKMNNYHQYEKNGGSNNILVKKDGQCSSATAAAADQDSSTTANESDDATLENYEPHHQNHHTHQRQNSAMLRHDHDTQDDLNMKNNNNGPKLNCDGTYLVCGVDDNDKSCIIS
jgi:small GTP-binding protein